MSPERERKFWKSEPEIPPEIPPEEVEKRRKREEWIPPEKWTPGKEPKEKSPEKGTPEKEKEEKND
jgi:hypothetical protein